VLELIRRKTVKSGISIFGTYPSEMALLNEIRAEIVILTQRRF